MSSKLYMKFFNEFQKLMSTRAGTLPNYYEILKIPRHSSQTDIKTAYYKLSKQYHPDKNTSAEAKVIFQNVSDAYEILGNIDKRIEYDRQLHIRSPYAKSMLQQARSRESELYRHGKHNLNDKKSKYNVDEWVRLHYPEGEKRKPEIKFNKILQKDKIVFNQHYMILPFIMMFLISTILIGDFSIKEDYDETYVKKKDNDS